MEIIYLQFSLDHEMLLPSRTREHKCTRMDRRMDRLRSGTELMHPFFYKNIVRIHLQYLNGQYVGKPYFL